MIEVNATFNEASVRQMGKGKRIGNYILFPIIAAALLAGAIATIVREHTTGELVLAIVLCVLSPSVVLLSFFMTRSETKANIQSFGVDQGDVTLNYKFSDSAVLVTRTAAGKTSKETVKFSELYKVKRTRKCFMLYLNKEEMFYVPTDAFVSGTADELFSLLYDAKVILDY